MFRPSVKIFFMLATILINIFHPSPRSLLPPAIAKKPIYFRNPLLREFVLFFVPEKMFHPLYLQCFTMYRSNGAVNWNIPLQQKNPHILETLIRKFVSFFVPLKNVLPSALIMFHYVWIKNIKCCSEPKHYFAICWNIVFI